jgi:hypothetical protein
MNNRIIFFILSLFIFVSCDSGDNELWKYKFADSSKMVESVVSDKNNIYFLQGDTLYALNKNTGAVIWKNKIAKITSSLFLDSLNNSILLISAEKNIISYNKTNGLKHWEKKVGNMYYGIFNSDNNKYIYAQQSVDSLGQLCIDITSIGKNGQFINKYLVPVNDSFNISSGYFICYLDTSMVYYISENAKDKKLTFVVKKYKTNEELSSVNDIETYLIEKENYLFRLYFATMGTRYANYVFEKKTGTFQNKYLDKGTYIEVDSTITAKCKINQDKDMDIIFYDKKQNVLKNIMVKGSILKVGSIQENGNRLLILKKGDSYSLNFLDKKNLTVEHVKNINEVLARNYLYSDEKNVYSYSLDNQSISAISIY